MASLKLALFQNNSCEGDIQGQLQSLEYAAEQALRKGSDLLVCPELFLTGYFIKDLLPDLAQQRNSQVMQNVAAIAKRFNLSLVFGYPEKDEHNLYNSVAVIDNNGQLLTNYRKIQLYGDFEKSIFQPGDEFISFSMKGVKIGILVCFDVEFPETVRQLAKSGVELIVVPTALSACFSNVSTILVPARAMENGVFVAYADFCGEENGHHYAGLSCIVDPSGNDLARAGTKEELIYATIGTDQIDSVREKLSYLTDLRESFYTNAINP